MFRSLVVGAVGIIGFSLAISVPALADPLPSTEELLRMLKEQQRTLNEQQQTIKELRSELKRSRPQTAAAPARVPENARTAMAADLQRAAPVYTAPPPQDWSGIYVGLAGGYGWGKQSANATIPGDQFSGTLLGIFPLVPTFFPAGAIPSAKQDGWLLGGFFGAQKQWGNWVLGIEGDIHGADIEGSGSSTASSALQQVSFVGTNPLICPPAPCVTLNRTLSIDSKIDMLASLRGKIGWSFAPNWLIYGTGGAAFAHTVTNVTSTETAAVDPGLALAGFTSVNNISRSLSGSATMFGWAAGAGVDWKLPLDAGSAWIFGVEYLHYGFPEQTLTLSNGAGGSFAFNAKEHIDTVKGRVSYLFSIR